MSRAVPVTVLKASVNTLNLILDANVVQLLTSFRLNQTCLANKPHCRSSNVL